MASKLLTINIRNYLVGQPRRKRAKRVSGYVRARIAHYTNVRFDNIRISKELNSLILKKHISSMKPLKVSIGMEKDKAIVTPFNEKAPAKEAAAAATTAKKEEKKPIATQQKQENERPKAAEPKQKQEAKRNDSKSGTDGKVQGA